MFTALELDQDALASVHQAPDLSVEHSRNQQDSPTYRLGEVSSPSVPAAIANTSSVSSWGIDTVKIGFKVDPSQCDRDSDLWVTSSTQNLRNDRPEAETFRGFYVLPALEREVKITINLYLMDGICHLSFNAARAVFAHKDELLPPDAMRPLVQGIVSQLLHAVWPTFVAVTADGEMVWSPDWAAQVSVKRLDIARNFEVDDAGPLRVVLPLQKGRYQRQVVTHDSGNGCWTIESPTNQVGKDKFYTKSALLALDPEESERMRARSKELLRFETQLMRGRLATYGLTTLDRVTEESTWAALEARWDATGWGTPLPETGDLLKAVEPLKPKDRALLIGYLHLAAAGAPSHLSEAQERRIRNLAKQCGVTVGVPVELVGEPISYLDLPTGTQQSMTPLMAVVAEMEANC